MEPQEKISNKVTLDNKHWNIPHQDMVSEIVPTEHVIFIGSSFNVFKFKPSSNLKLYFVDVDREKYLSNLLCHFDNDTETYSAIIISEEIGITNLSILLDVIGSNGNIEQTPVLLCCGEHNRCLELCKNYSQIDDVVSIQKFTSEELARKIQFLRKIKSIKNRKSRCSSVPPTIHPILYKIDYIIRRFLDIIIASIVTFILSPLFLIISIVIRFESKGPIFYAAYRAGRDYRIFKFFKFRSMVYNADSQLESLKFDNQYHASSPGGPMFFKVANDPRITKFGSFLRKTSLDELPQLINVLKGEMSLVGNRPLPLYEAATLTRDDCAERFLAPAGITGLWQIEKRGRSEMSASERIGLDIRYAHNNSVWSDLKIILKTPFSMRQKEKV